ncbi:unnamed protein product [Cyprideis torosa]|uniref:Uncharacterized protein n=1 Tax=Cyprideis torosa TaxID=163714 RepID=A0A7R8WHG6_9CRUS|nr:unnamed protein product [Cyprideis torosa]CAG0899385.1 unnamed protein product [Cyprideis torosa]
MAATAASRSPTSPFGMSHQFRTWSSTTSEDLDESDLLLREDSVSKPIIPDHFVRGLSSDLASSVRVETPVESGLESSSAIEECLKRLATVASELEELRRTRAGDSGDEAQRLASKLREKVTELEIVFDQIDALERLVLHVRGRVEETGRLVSEAERQGAAPTTRMLKNWFGSLSRRSGASVGTPAMPSSFSSEPHDLSHLRIRLEEFLGCHHEQWVPSPPAVPLRQEGCDTPLRYPPGFVLRRHSHVTLKLASSERRFFQALPTEKAQTSFSSQVPVAKPDGRKTCTLIPGDGVGPELVNCVKEIFEAANVPIDFEEFIFSEVDPHSAPFEDVLESIERNGICLKGSMKIPDSSPSGELGSLSMKLRRRLDLFANVVIAKSIHGIDTRHKNVDLIIIREQTEGEYSGIEHESVPGVVESLKVVTRKQSRRIAKFAFDYATKWGRKKVTAVHKANIMKLGDGLFLESCREVAKLYPRIEYAEERLDRVVRRLVTGATTHQKYDTLLSSSLYGKVLNFVAAGLVGGPGCVTGLEVSPKAFAFKSGIGLIDLANPVPIVMASTQLLFVMDLKQEAALIRGAVAATLEEGTVSAFCLLLAMNPTLSFSQVSTLYPRIAFDSMIVDNCTMQLVSNPHQFDVLVMPNLYGTIVSNVCAGLIGGAGVCPGASFSHDVVAYEPVSVPTSLENRI